jgi:16S rRNA A1518/A1519 N6-dimethyltransferase RsmA/KsgA/DIM1 with predicted DNA glycosylase/AP lyase activity
VLDIGAGEGALTAHLVRAGARVIAVELNPGRARVLRERFPEMAVLQIDATALRLPGRPFRWTRGLRCRGAPSCRRRTWTLPYSSCGVVSRPA